MLSGFDKYDFTVGKIEFIAKRSADKRWKLEKCSYSDRYVLAYNFSGRAYYKTDTEFTVNSGDILFFKKDEAHSAFSDANEPWEFCSICFEIIPFSKDASDALNSLPTLIHQESGLPIAKRFADVCRIWNPSADGNLIYCRSLICSLISMTIQSSLKAENPYDERIEKIVEMLNENYGKNYSIQQLAEISNLSASHFRALFKSYTGQSVIQFQNSVKLQKACDLLKSGGTNVSEVADMLGFESVFYFSRIFKMKLGVSPSEYIKNAFRT